MVKENIGFLSPQCMTEFISCLEIQSTERPMIAKGKRQAPQQNETFLRG